MQATPCRVPWNALPPLLYPPYPTHSPAFVWPTFSLSLASHFSASSPLLRLGHISVTLASRSLSLQRPPLVRSSEPGQVPSVFLRSRMRRITGIPPSKPKVVLPSRRAFPSPPHLRRDISRGVVRLRTAAYTNFSRVIGYRASIDFDSSRYIFIALNFTRFFFFSIKTYEESN